jgi:tetratricopeptide (TPR) repeat protein
MAFRVNRSFGIVPGVRFRVNKGSVGLTLGKGPFHYTVNSRGRRTSSVGIPGTGMYFQDSQGGSRSGSGRRRTSARRVPAAATAPDPPVIHGSAIDAVATSATTRRPGLFASKAERAFHRALAERDSDALEQVAAAGDRCALAANTLLAITAPAEDRAGLERRARALHAALEAGDPATDPLLRKYTPGLVVYVPVTAQVSAEIGMSREGLALLYVELLQELDRLEEAAAYVAALPRNEVSALSLAELWVALERWDDVVGLTTGVENTDDFTALMLVYRGIAFRAQGHYDAAREAFRAALRSKKRNPTIRHLALFARAQCSVEQRRFAAARKDLETILNENPSYEGLADAIAALPPPKGAVAEPDDVIDVEGEESEDATPTAIGPPTMIA